MILSTIILGGLLLMVAGYYWRKSIKGGCNLPGPIGFPIIGIYPFLNGEFFFYLFRMGKTYGDIYHCRIGTANVVVVNSFEITEDMLRKKAELFNDRAFGTPENIDIPVGFAELDMRDKWKELRNISVSILNNQNVGEPSLYEMINNEVTNLRKFVEKTFQQKPFNIRPLLLHSMGNILISLMFNRRIEYGHKEMETLIRNVHDTLLSMNPFHSPLFSQLKTYFGFSTDKDLFRGQEAIGKIVNICEKEIEKHLSNSIEKPKDFIDLCLTEIEAKKQDGKTTFLTHNSMSGICENLFVGGLDSTGQYLTWLIHLLTKYPDVQRRLRDEIDDVIGRNRNPTLSDRDSMPYLKAVLQETHRYASIVPVAIFHRCSKDITYNNYNIPAGFYIMINYYAIHHSERYFDNPSEFNPSRFINQQGDFIKSKYVIPFSIGPRVCPGEVLVQRESFLFLAQILQHYNLIPPKGISPESMPTTIRYEAGGILVSDFDVVFSPRTD
ncbi:Cytochrome P450 2F3 [Holothuria leucospilota]|uniref:Cytochrome P450 2F3 n=1 Tax=Holothuria leucospilota TaxID=206669 RepID=A0A9Q1C741_HOLLE|nr:Cytochrome P450 2F3 [Holothuria leucospilota]